MYAGELVEEGTAAEVLQRPRHPYTRGLIESLPERAESGPLPSIPGSPPPPGQLPQGCAFAPRCSLATADCEIAPIPLVPVESDHLARCIRSEALAADLKQDSQANVRGGRQV
jgi:oligopeptide/dipeptide ABC transporter ATP-binding protein